MIERADAVLNGDRRALARLLTDVENEREGVTSVLAALFPHTGHAAIIGITGAPGTGKSSLVNAMTQTYRVQNKTVAILAVDPTSPFSGGAILGDRIRMRDLAGDKGVFIRSMAARGTLGGLARAAHNAIRVMDAAGFDIILVETVGAGQSEVEIARAAQTVIVVEAPGLGDDIQAIKAGILEIADVLVVNKADKPGVENTIRALKTMLELGHPATRSQMTRHHGHVMNTDVAINGHVALWLPPIIRTVAVENRGIDELLAAVESHRQYLAQDNVLMRLERDHLQTELQERLSAALLARFLANIPNDALPAIIQRIQARQLDPQSAVNELLALPVNL
jgi:LAO/AO transport system kinase